MTDAAAPGAVVLLSGGLDSATTLACAKNEGFDIYALTLRYGQRHALEVRAAASFADAMGVARHLVLDLDLTQIGGSALTADIPVPKNRNLTDGPAEIPITYVPARNTILLGLAVAWAESLQIHDIFIGVNVLDYSGYPDCRAEFLRAFQRVANLGTRLAVRNVAKFHIHAPLIRMSKQEIIAEALRLGVDLSLTRSCYDPWPDGASCGTCDACRLRLSGFASLGIRDPAPYAPP